LSYLQLAEAGKNRDRERKLQMARETGEGSTEGKAKNDAKKKLRARVSRQGNEVKGSIRIVRVWPTAGGSKYAAIAEADVQPKRKK